MLSKGGKSGFVQSLPGFVLFCISLSARTLNVDDILSIRTLQNVVISPDGSRIAFVVNEPSDDEHSKDPPNTDLYIAPVNGGGPKRLTSNHGRDSDPQWAPDSSSLVFLSTRPDNAGSQLYRIHAEGGAPAALTRHPTTISSFAWSPDGKQIAFLATEPPSEALKKRLQRGDDGITLDSFDTDQNAPPQRVWILDVATGQTRIVSTGQYHVTSVAWSPDGSRFLLTITDHANLDYEWTRARLAVVPVRGSAPEVYCATRGKLARPGWIPDGSGISFLGASANGTEQAPSSLFVCRGAGSAPVNLTQGQRYSAQGYRWLPDSRSLVLTIVERNSRYLAKLDAGSRRLEKLSVPRQVISGDVSLSRDGRQLACVFEEPHRPPDLWAGPLGEQLRQITHLNPALEELTYGETEELDWKARDGWDITGILVKPVGYQTGVRYPMVVQVHGGPESADLNGFQLSWAQLFAAHGYAVFLPNYRGSVGRGVDYTIANHGDRGGKDFLDILDGVDALIARGIADPARLAIGGWSYGGFMSSWAVTQTDRFKAAVVGVGITDWFSLMGMAPVPMWNAEAHFLVWPYDQPEAYWKFSPALQVKKVKTPTLLLWGEVDPLVPPAQGREFFRGLRLYGVPSEMVVYPREGHGLRERLHRRDAYGRVLDWYARYVKSVAKD
jgi:dipeptidyl aminopeptidase/acylaminoacyl peptidase